MKVTHNGTAHTNPDLEKGTKYYPIESLTKEESVSMVIDSPFSMVNGNMTRIYADNNEIAPFTVNSRTLVPIRFVAEAFGAEVAWDGDKREITIKQDDNTIKLVIDSASYTINDKEMTLDVPATIISSLTYIPLRTVAEALDKKVAWDNLGVIHISSNVDLLTDEQAVILYDAIVNYVEPEKKEERVALSSEVLNEKQLSVYAVDATADDGNIAMGAVDGNFETRRNAFGEGETLTLDLGTVQEIAAVEMSFYKGYERQYYFDIAVSEDGENWTTALAIQASSGSAVEGVL